MPQPSVTFYHKAKLLDSSYHGVIHYGDISTKHGTRAYGGALCIDTPSHYDNGNYTLIAENFLGVDTKWGMQIFMETPKKSLPGFQKLPTHNERANENIVLRLVDGDHSASGRLDIYYNDEWGSICDDKFDRNDAKVACRQLGFIDAGGIIKDGSFTRGMNMIY